MKVVFSSIKKLKIYIICNCMMTVLDWLLSTVLWSQYQYKKHMRKRKATMLASVASRTTHCWCTTWRWQRFRVRRTTRRITTSQAEVPHPCGHVECCAGQKRLKGSDKCRIQAAFPSLHPAGWCHEPAVSSLHEHQLQWCKSILF